MSLTEYLRLGQEATTKKKGKKPGKLRIRGKRFTITGKVGSWARHQVERMITNKGGRVLPNVTGATDFLVVGYRPGRTKIEAAERRNIKQLPAKDLIVAIQ